MLTAWKLSSGSCDMSLLPAVTMLLVLFSTLCLFAVMAKCGPGDTHCSQNYQRTGFQYFARYFLCLFVNRFCQYNNVTTLQDAVTTLNRCVVEIKMRAKFEDVVHSFFIIAPSLCCCNTVHVPIVGIIKLSDGEISGLFFLRLSWTHLSTKWSNLLNLQFIKKLISTF